MKSSEFDAVDLKRELQKKAEEKLSGLSNAQQLDFLRRKFGQIIKSGGGKIARPGK